MSGYDMVDAPAVFRGALEDKLFFSFSPAFQLFMASWPLMQLILITHDCKD